MLTFPILIFIINQIKSAIIDSTETITSSALSATTKTITTKPVTPEATTKTTTAGNKKNLSMA